MFDIEREGWRHTSIIHRSMQLFCFVSSVDTAPLVNKFTGKDQWTIDHLFDCVYAVWKTIVVV